MLAGIGLDVPVRPALAQAAEHASLDRSRMVPLVPSMSEPVPTRQTVGDLPRRMVLVVNGSPGATGSADWPALVDDWRRSMAEEAAAAAMEFSFDRHGQAALQQPTAVVTITVNGFNYLSQRRRSLLGVFAGQAALDVRAEIRHWPSGRIVASRHFATNGDHAGVFGAATPRQVREAAHRILTEFRPH